MVDRPRTEAPAPHYQKVGEAKIEDRPRTKDAPSMARAGRCRPWRRGGAKALSRAVHSCFNFRRDKAIFTQAVRGE